jgi:hypothetical protein
MRNYYEEWWALYHLSLIDSSGSDKENPVIMTCRDSHVHDSKSLGIKKYAKLKNPFGGRVHFRI